MSGDSSIQANQIRKLDFKPQNGGDSLKTSDEASFVQIESSKTRAGDLRSTIAPRNNLPVTDITDQTAVSMPIKLSHDEVYAEINDFYKLASGRDLI